MSIGFGERQFIQLEAEAKKNPQITPHLVQESIYHLFNIIVVYGRYYLMIWIKLSKVAY